MTQKISLAPNKKYQLLISSLHSIYRLLNSTYELKDLISRLSRLICQMFDAQYCLIVMLDSSKQYSSLRCLSNNKKKSILDKKAKIVNRLEKKIIKKTISIRQDDLIGLPLISDDIIGFIIVRRLNKARAGFDHSEMEVLTTLAEQVTVGIKNLQLYEEQQKTVLGSIKSLVTLLDMRMPQEYTHSPYFSKLVIGIANQMNLDAKQAESLKYASLLHDTGKIDIPMEILTKTTKLTKEELLIIKNHPARGAQILRPLQILRPVIPIIMHHHEKYDGTGYPSRLRKGQIPQGARVMAVADAFEAMVYGRPYRERMNIPSAVKEIKKKSGTQFDPKVVEAFLKVVKNIKTKKYLQANP